MKFLSEKKGSTLILVALGMTVFLGFAALVTDIGMIKFHQGKLQNAVDAAALAAGQELANESSKSEDSGDEAENYIGYNAEDVTFDKTDEKYFRVYNYGNSGKRVKVYAEKTVDLHIAKVVFGKDEAQVTAKAVAQCASVTEMKGLRPFGVYEDEYQDMVEGGLLKGDSWKEMGDNPGNYGFVGLEYNGNTTGTPVIKGCIENGSTKLYKIGDSINTITGNKTSTYEAMESLFAAKGNPDTLIVYIPIIALEEDKDKDKDKGKDKDKDPGGTFEVVIKGFAAYEVQKPVDKKNVMGRFVESGVIPAVGDPNNINSYGVKAVNLVE